MAYFPNGTSGDIFQERWCERCIHGYGEASGCAVWFAHLLHNYERGSKAAEILDVLIPNEGVHPGECRMFNPNPRPKEHPNGPAFAQAVEMQEDKP